MQPLSDRDEEQITTYRGGLEEADQRPTRPSIGPWLAIWVRPRDTIREIVHARPNHCVLRLAVGAGIARATCNMASDHGATVKEHFWRYLLGDPFLWMVTIVVGTAGALFWLYVGAALLRLTGRWLDGNATARDGRAVVAWGCCFPSMCSDVCHLIALVLRTAGSFGGFVAFLGLCAIFVVWGLVLFLKCIQEIQGFSVGQAIGNVILAALPAFVIGWVLTTTAAGWAWWVTSRGS